MKKIVLLMILLMGLGTLSPLYAADDLDELEGLVEEMKDQNTINGESETETASEIENVTDEGGINTETNIEDESNMEDMTEIEDISNETELNTVGEDASKKLTLTEKDVTSDGVTLEFEPLEEYTNYKVYYTKNGEENFNEKEVIVDNQDTTETMEVVIDGLKSDTEYQFIVKAFDNEGNPIEATASDPIIVRTSQEQHAAPSDNVIYEPVVKVEKNKIIITWKPGVDVQKVQISLSEDGKTFKPVATVSADKKTYTIVTDKTGKKYIKLVPISKDGTLGVCKIGSTEVPYITTNVQLKKEAEKKIGHTKTGPETYLLLLIALIIATVYVYRKRLS